MRGCYYTHAIFPLDSVNCWVTWRHWAHRAELLRCGPCPPGARDPGKKTARKRCKKEGLHPPTLYLELSHYHRGTGHSSQWPLPDKQSTAGPLSPGMRNPRIQRADCNHCSMTFYIRDLSVLGFWSLQRVLEPIPRGYTEAQMYQLSINPKRWNSLLNVL